MFDNRHSFMMDKVSEYKLLPSFPGTLPYPQGPLSNFRQSLSHIKTWTINIKHNQKRELEGIQFSYCWAQLLKKGEMRDGVLPGGLNING